MKGFVKMIEAQQVLLEDARGQEQRLPLHLLPQGAQIGDYIYEIAETGAYQIDPDITRQRQEELGRLSGWDFS